MRRVHLALAVLLLLPACAVTGEPQQTAAVRVREIEVGEGITQTFVPRGEPLSRVEVLVATYQVEAPDVVVTVRVEGAGAERVARVDGSDFGDAQWVTFLFPPIEDAAGERFTATLSYEGSQRLGVYVNPYDPYQEGELRPGGGDLAFKVGHSGRLANGWSAIGRVAREFGGRLAADPAFAVAWGLAMVAAVAGSLRRGTAE